MMRAGGILLLLAHTCAIPIKVDEILCSQAYAYTPTDTFDLQCAQGTYVSKITIKRETSIYYYYAGDIARSGTKISGFTIYCDSTYTAANSKSVSMGGTLSDDFSPSNQRPGFVGTYIHSSDTHLTRFTLYTEWHNGGILAAGSDTTYWTDGYDYKLDTLVCPMNTRLVGMYGHTWQADKAITGVGFYCDYFACGSSVDGTCTCPAGYGKVNQPQDVCTICPSGTFRANSLQTDNACLSCTTAAYTLEGVRKNDGAVYTSPTGMTKDECAYTCNAGFGSPGYQMNFCAPCVTGTYKSIAGNTLQCTKCAPGKYQDAPGQTACKDCTAGTNFANLEGQSICSPCTSPTIPVGSYKAVCTVISDAQAKACTFVCNAGYEIESLCETVRTSQPSCVQCPAGTIQPNNNANRAQCSTCGAGLYQDAPGQGSCKSCTPLSPTPNGAYTEWALPTSNACPWTCNGGYVKLNNLCGGCPTGQWVSESTCSACTNKPDNAYYLTPPSTPGSNACPWDCNAGYYKDTAYSCHVCDAGSTYASALQKRTLSTEEANKCSPCTVCNPPTTYESRGCTKTEDTVCSACSAPCGAGTYTSAACQMTSDRVCTGCKTTCEANQFIQTTCNPQASTDTTVCTGCYTGSSCIPGLTYLPALCTGTETQQNGCRQAPLKTRFNPAQTRFKPAQNPFQPRSNPIPQDLHGPGLPRRPIREPLFRHARHLVQTINHMQPRVLPDQLRHLHGRHLHPVLHLRLRHTHRMPGPRRHGVRGDNLQCPDPLHQHAHPQLLLLFWCLRGLPEWILVRRLELLRVPPPDHLRRHGEAGRSWFKHAFTRL